MTLVLRSALMLALLAVAPGAAPAQVPAAPRLTDAEARFLAAHNSERAAVRVPALVWDARLAADAAAYARRLAPIGRLQHSPRAERPGQSENLFMGSRGAYSPEQMVGWWTAERTDFRAGVFPNVSRTGNWLDVSHYTQMIWRGTTSLGCAVYSDRRTDYLVCRYAPRGNIDGRAVP